MLRTLRLSPLLVCATLALLVLPGCGKKGAPVKGKLVLPPEVKLADNDTVKVTFIPDKTGAEGYSGKVSPSDLSFVVDSGNKKGVQPGKYKVAVSIQPYPGGEGTAERKQKLQPLNSAYDPGTTKLTYDVTSDSNQSITIDLTKGSVTKN